MDNKKYVELFKKDCKFYDKENKELRAILSLIKPDKSKTLIDIGAGIGRLSIPLLKYFKVTTIDINKHLLNEINSKNIIKINKKIENYYPKNKFDYVLIAWPAFTIRTAKLLNHLKKNVLKENGKLVIIKAISLDYWALSDKLFKGPVKNPTTFLKLLNKYFTLKKQKIIRTSYIFPNFKIAFDITIFEFFAFWNKKVNKKHLKIIKSFLNTKTRKGKVYIKAKLKAILYTNS